MRARDLRGAALILIAGTTFGLSGGSAHAEGAAQELDAAGSEGGEPTRNAAGARSRRDPSQTRERQAAWWTHAREVLFQDLALSAEQTREVDAIFEGQQAALRRSEELQAELEAARERRDEQRIVALRKQLRTNGARLRNPHARIEEIRALLTPEQRPTFDMNRARLVAEGQQSRKARQGQRQRRPAADAEGNAE